MITLEGSARRAGRRLTLASLVCAAVALTGAAAAQQAKSDKRRLTTSEIRSLYVGKVRYQVDERTHRRAPYEWFDADGTYRVWVSGGIVGSHFGKATYEIVDNELRFRSSGITGSAETAGQKKIVRRLEIYQDREGRIYSRQAGVGPIGFSIEFPLEVRHD